jgi:hypothetical protein
MTVRLRRKSIGVTMPTLDGERMGGTAGELERQASDGRRAVAWWVIRGVLVLVAALLLAAGENRYVGFLRASHVDGFGTHVDEWWISELLLVAAGAAFVLAIRLPFHEHAHPGAALLALIPAAVVVHFWWVFLRGAPAGPRIFWFDSLEVASIAALLVGVALASVPGRRTVRPRSD